MMKQMDREKAPGRAWVFGDNVSTDDIIPGRYSASADHNMFRQHVFENMRPEFVREVKPRDIVVAGKNFGCGSSRESAAMSMKVCGVKYVVARSYGWIFKRNCINVGILPLQLVDECSVEDGSQVEVDLERYRLIDQTTGKDYALKPLHPLAFKIHGSGGLIPYLNKYGDYIW